MSQKIDICVCGYKGTPNHIKNCNYCGKPIKKEKVRRVKRKGKQSQMELLHELESYFTKQIPKVIDTRQSEEQGDGSFCLVFKTDKLRKNSFNFTVETTNIYKDLG